MADNPLSREAASIQKFLTALDINLTLADGEKQAITVALILTDNNIMKTAKRLGISRASLYRKIKEYEIRIRKPIVTGDRLVATLTTNLR